MRILGVSPFHDSSVAIVNNGKLEKFFKEERLTKVKRDRVPFKSIIAALQSVDYKVDYSVIASPSANDQFNNTLEQFLHKVTDRPVERYCHNHHLAHASLAFYNSGYDNALVFVIDRNGSIVNDINREAETVFSASYPCKFETLHKNYWVFNKGADWDINNLNSHTVLSHLGHSFNDDSNMSVVRVYESATTLIGQDPLENGKTMGLASYGIDKPYEHFFVNGRPNDNLFVNGNFVMPDYTTTLMRKHIGYVNKDINEHNYQFFADHAYQVQKQTQEFVLEFVKEWVEKTKIRNVCLTGGYALNVVANGYLVKNLPNVNFYFEPLADDSGNSIGAAIHSYRAKTNDTKKYPLETTFVHGIEKSISVVGKPVTTSQIAKFLNMGKTVAVFNGLAESGPRALGNRSILFDATNKDAKQIVNTIKRREWYRPFAGMVLEDDFSEYFETCGLLKSEYMTVSFEVKDSNRIPGVTHVDNTCRVQTVGKNIPHIYELLNEFKKISGCSVILNTSFNMAGRPLIEDQQEAIDTFNASSIDVLWFPETNTCLVKNEELL